MYEDDPQDDDEKALQEALALSMVPDGDQTEKYIVDKSYKVEGKLED